MYFLFISLGHGLCVFCSAFGLRETCETNDTCAGEQAGRKNKHMLADGNQTQTFKAIDFILELGNLAFSLGSTLLCLY